MTDHKVIIEAARKIVALYDAEAVAFKEVGRHGEKFVIARTALEDELSEDGPDIARAFIALHARCTKLETALRFYADPKRYEGPNQRAEPGDEWTAPDAPYRQDVGRDNGRNARAALAEGSK